MFFTLLSKTRYCLHEVVIVNNNKKTIKHRISKIHIEKIYNISCLRIEQKYKKLFEYVKLILLI